MEFLVVFICTLAACAALRNFVLKVPLVFYALALVAVVAYVLGASGVIPLSAIRPAVVLVQRCMVAFSLFAIVMLIGVVSERTRVGLWFRPIRGELSIVAFILCLGHIIAYFAPYAARAFAGSLKMATLVGFAVAIVAGVLLVMLGVTSLGAVKRRMSSDVWRKLQKLSYVFFGLAYVHVMLMLAPSALAGGAQASTSVAVYSAIAIAYVALRVRKSLRDERGKGRRDDCMCIT